MPPGLRSAPWRWEHAADVLVLVCVIAVPVVAECAARSGRVLASPPAVVHCERPVAVLDVWRGARVHGRVLAHFARKLEAEADEDRAATPDAKAPTDRAFVRHAIETGIVRRVVHVLSPRDWPEVERNLLAFAEARASGRGFQLSWQGTPIDVVRLEDLPELGEPVVADVDADRWTPAELEQIARWLAGRPRADLVAWYGTAGRFPEESLRAAAR